MVKVPPPDKSPRRGEINRRELFTGPRKINDTGHNRDNTLLHAVTKAPEILSKKMTRHEFMTGLASIAGATFALEVVGALLDSDTLPPAGEADTLERINLFRPSADDLTILGEAIEYEEQKLDQKNLPFIMVATCALNGTAAFTSGIKDIELKDLLKEMNDELDENVKKCIKDLIIVNTEATEATKKSPFVYAEKLMQVLNDYNMGDDLTTPDLNTLSQAIPAIKELVQRNPREFKSKGWTGTDIELIAERIIDQVDPHKGVVFKPAHRPSSEASDLLKIYLGVGTGHLDEEKHPDPNIESFKKFFRNIPGYFRWPVAIAYADSELSNFTDINQFDLVQQRIINRANRLRREQKKDLDETIFEQGLLLDEGPLKQEYEKLRTRLHNLKKKMVIQNIIFFNHCYASVAHLAQINRFFERAKEKAQKAKIFNRLSINNRVEKVSPEVWNSMLPVDVDGEIDLKTYPLLSKKYIVKLKSPKKGILGQVPKVYKLVNSTKNITDRSQDIKHSLNFVEKVLKIPFPKDQPENQGWFKYSLSDDMIESMKHKPVIPVKTSPFTAPPNSEISIEYRP